VFGVFLFISIIILFELQYHRNISVIVMAILFSMCRKLLCNIPRE
jgi:hypothetical protein